MHIQDIVATRTPLVALPLMSRMGKTLLRDAPTDPTPLILNAHDRLLTELERVDAAVEARVRAENAHVVADELLFDRCVDSLWVMLRSTLELRAAALRHPGLDQLSPELQAKLDLEQLRELGERAATVHDALFAANGTRFIKASMPAQSEAMVALLRIIEGDALAPLIAEATEDQFLPLLRACQEQYEDMVSTRLGREQGVRHNLRSLAVDLRWRVDRYKAAVETLYDEDDPTSVETIHTALRSLIAVSKRASAAASSGARLEVDAELDASLVEASEVFSELEGLSSEPEGAASAAE